MVGSRSLSVEDRVAEGLATGGGSIVFPVRRVCVTVIFIFLIVKLCSDIISAVLVKACRSRDLCITWVVRKKNDDLVNPQLK